MRTATHPQPTARVLCAIASFGMTFFRIGIALYIGFCILLGTTSRKEIAVVGTLAIMILDYYDGLLFDKSVLKFNKQWRVRRRVLDSTVDRFVIQSVAIPVLLVDPSFLWLYLFILVRETFLSAYNTFLFKRGFLVYPGPVAKLACVLVGLSGIAFLLTNAVVTTALTAIMGILSFLSYREYRNKVRRFQMEGAVAVEEPDIIEVF